MATAMGTCSLLLAACLTLSTVDAIPHHAAPPQQYSHTHRTTPSQRFSLNTLLSKDVRRLLFTVLGLLLAAAWLYKRYTTSTTRQRQRTERAQRRQQQPAAAGAAAATNDTAAAAPTLFQRLTSTGRSNAPSLTPSTHPQETYLSTTSAPAKQRLVVINATALHSATVSDATNSNVEYVRRLAQSNAVWIVHQVEDTSVTSSATSSNLATAASDAGGLTVPPMTAAHEQQVGQLKQQLAKHNLLSEDRSSTAGMHSHRVLLCSTARGKVAIVRHLQPSLYIDAVQDEQQHQSAPTESSSESPLDICKELAPYLKDVVCLQPDATSSSTMTGNTNKGQVTVCSTLHQYFHR